MSTMRWAFVGDLQLPWENKRAVALWFKIMKAWRPDVIDIVGDISDQLEYSRFSDGTTDEFIKQIAKRDEGWELNLLDHIQAGEKPARDFYTTLRKQHKNAEIHLSRGNHDDRIIKYVDRKMPDFLPSITAENLWGLDTLGISSTLYEDRPVLRHGGIHVHHGETTTTTGLAVKNDIENYNISLVRGHDHRGGVVYKSYPLSNTTLQGMGTGHLCDPNAYGLRYAISPSWELGFGIAHVDDNGYAHLQFIPITPDYIAVVDGKVFQG